MKRCIREAEQIRLARMAAKANGTESLLSRMVKLLSRSSRPSQSNGTLGKATLLSTSWHTPRVAELGTPAVRLKQESLDHQFLTNRSIGKMPMEQTQKRGQDATPCKVNKCGT